MFYSVLSASLGPGPLRDLAYEDTIIQHYINLRSSINGFNFTPKVDVAGSVTDSSALPVWIDCDMC